MTQPKEMTIDEAVAIRLGNEVGALKARLTKAEILNEVLASKVERYEAEKQAQEEETKEAGE